MPLISPSDLLRLTDKVAATYSRWGVSIGVADEIGTDGYLAAQALARVVSGSPDYDVQQDLGASLNSSTIGLRRGPLASSIWKSFLDALDAHMQRLGDGVDSAILDLQTYLEYYNTTPYAALIASDLADLYSDLYAVALLPATVMQPAIHPFSGAPSGMGTRSVGGPFVAGTSPNALYAPVTGSVEVTTDFSGGSAPPTYTVAGVDDAGLLTTTWTATGGSNDPVSAVSTTITPAVAAMARQAVAVGAATGISVGSLLLVNAGLIDQETVVVEALVGTTLTACFAQAHPAGAFLTGFTTLPLVPSVTGARIASVSGVTIGITGHSAGAVRVCGVRDRGYRMD